MGVNRRLQRGRLRDVERYHWHWKREHGNERHAESEQHERLDSHVCQFGKQPDRYERQHAQQSNADERQLNLYAIKPEHCNVSEQFEYCNECQHCYEPEQHESVDIHGDEQVKQIVIEQQVDEHGNNGQHRDYDFCQHRHQREHGIDRDVR